MSGRNWFWDRVDLTRRLARIVVAALILLIVGAVLFGLINNR